MADNAIKEQGQVFTPGWVVSLVLDSAGYSGPGIVGKRVLEPSCGDGAFLMEISRRLISECLSAGMCDADIRDALSSGITGMDSDADLVSATGATLDELARDAGIVGVRWDLRCGDTLVWAKETEERFDLVAGNPPYVRIHNLSEETRAFVRENYATCGKGMTDAYVAFIEAGVGLLAPGGRLAYITPSSWLYTVTAKPLRRMLLDRDLVRSVTDFGDGLVFPDASTYTAVTVLGDGEGFEYRTGDASGGPSGDAFGVDASLLGESPWILPQEEDGTGDAVGDTVRVQYGVGTYADSVYFSGPADGGGATVEFNGTEIERGILLPAVKVSTWKADSVPGWGIWPYRETPGGLRVIPRADMESEFPLALAYLDSHRERLEGRSLVPGYAEHYEYARSQALGYVGRDKLVMSPVVKDSYAAHLVPGPSIPYGGFFASGEPGALERVRDAVGSDAFVGFARRHGKPMRGGWRVMKASDFRQYRMPAA